MGRTTLTGICVVLVTGCAATYSPPLTRAQTLAIPTEDPAETLIKTGQALAARGYQVNRDAEAGILTTGLKQRRLTPAQADCGTTMGIDYLDDKRTTTRVGYSLVAGDGEVMVKAIVEGEYKPGSVGQDITLTCVSRGALERELASDL